MEETKVQEISSWSTPAFKRDVQYFLRIINFYHRFIKGCAAIARPLTCHTGKALFQWGNREQQSFGRLRTAISSAPVLRSLDPSLPTFVTTDSSGYALGAF
jgi:hypothetical protein